MSQRKGLHAEQTGARPMETRLAPIQFTLVVDDFGVKNVGKEHVLHLQQTLEEHYKVTKDWTGS